MSFLSFTSGCFIPKMDATALVFVIMYFFIAPKRLTTDSADFHVVLLLQHLALRQRWLTNSVTTVA